MVLLARCRLYRDCSAAYEDRRTSDRRIHSRRVDRALFTPLMQIDAESTMYIERYGPRRY